jgi:hypothetical protein
MQEEGEQEQRGEGEEKNERFHGQAPSRIGQPGIGARNLREGEEGFADSESADFDVLEIRGSHAAGFGEL